MTYSEVKSAGAEVVLDAFTRLPSDGWEELTHDEVRQINEEAAEQLKEAGRGNRADDVRSLYNSSAAALKKAEAGERVFHVEWGNTHCFAATKTK